MPPVLGVPGHDVGQRQSFKVIVILSVKSFTRVTAASPEISTSGFMFMEGLSQMYKGGKKKFLSKRRLYIVGHVQSTPTFSTFSSYVPENSGVHALEEALFFGIRSARNCVMPIWDCQASCGAHRTFQRSPSSLK